MAAMKSNFRVALEALVQLPPDDRKAPVEVLMKRPAGMLTLVETAPKNTPPPARTANWLGPELIKLRSWESANSMLP